MGQALEYKRKVSWEDANQLNLASCKELLLQNKNVLLDTYTNSTKGRKAYQVFTERNGGVYSVTYIHTDVSKIKKIHLKNKLHKVRHEISDESLDKAIESFIPPYMDNNSIGFVM